MPDYGFRCEGRFSKRARGNGSRRKSKDIVPGGTPHGYKFGSQPSQTTKKALDGEELRRWQGQIGNGPEPLKAETQIRVMRYSSTGPTSRPAGVGVGNSIRDKSRELRHVT